MIHRVLHLRPIASDQEEEYHSTGEAGEPAHHHQRALNALLLPSFSHDLCAEPDQARAGKLRQMFRGHLFENGIEVRVIHGEEPPILLFQISRGLWRARGRESL